MLTHQLFEKMTKGQFESRFLAFMEACELSEVHAQYSGGGDSGGLDRVRCYGNDHNGSIQRLESTLSSYGNKAHDQISDPIYNKFGSFADGGGYPVDGAIVYKDTMVLLEGTHHYYECDEDGEETENRDEEFSEELWSTDPFVCRDPEDFVLVNLYATEYLQSKLPEEFHNRMITVAALNSDQSAVEYLNKFGK